MGFQVEPVSDLRELEGEVNKEAVCKTTSGGTASGRQGGVDWTFGKVLCCNYISNGLLCTGSDDKMVKIWDNRSRNPIQTLPDALDSITYVGELSSIIMTSSIDGCVRQYDLRKGILKIDSFSYPIISMDLSTCITDCYIIGLLDDSIKLIECGIILQEYKGHLYNNYKIKCIFDPLEQFILSGCSSGDIYYWAIDNGEKSYKLYENAHNGIITSIAFSNPQLLTNKGKLKHDIEKNIKDIILNDNTLFVTTGKDGVINIWKFNYLK